MDSLTDIVSNSVGILIIFAVINLIHDNNKTYQLEIPIQHRTHLKPAFYLIKDDKILTLDEDKIFTNATLQATNGAAANQRIFALDYFGLLAKINKNNGISFYARDTALWSSSNELGQGNSQITQNLKSLKPNKQFAFFFVYDINDDETFNGFEAFREARDFLKARGIKSGWKPVNDEMPAKICNEFMSKECEFLPSYLGDG